MHSGEALHQRDPQPGSLVRPHHMCLGLSEYGSTSGAAPLNCLCLSRCDDDRRLDPTPSVVMVEVLADTRFDATLDETGDVARDVLLRVFRTALADRRADAANAAGSRSVSTASATPPSRSAARLLSAFRKLRGHRAQTNQYPAQS